MKKAIISALASAVLLTSVIPTFAQGGSTSSGGGSTSTSGGGGTSTKSSIDTVKVSKNYWRVDGFMLLNASSSEGARIFAYRPTSELIGEVVNGRYGGTVYYVGADPGYITFTSVLGGTINAPTELLSFVN